MQIIHDVVCSYICREIRNMQREVLDELALVLTEDEAMSTITTPEERLLIKQILDFAASSCFQRASAATLVFPLDGGIAARMTINYQGYAAQLFPAGHRADQVFNSSKCNQEVREQIVTHVSSLVDAALPRAAMEHSLHVLDRLASDTDQISFYLPWLARVLDEKLPDNTEHYHNVLGYTRSGSASRPTVADLKALRKPKPPKSYLTLTREERDFCKQGNAALAHYALLKEVSLKRPAPCAVVTLEGGPFIKSPFDLSIYTRLVIA